MWLYVVFVVLSVIGSGFVGKVKSTKKISQLVSDRVSVQRLLSSISRKEYVCPGS